MLNIRFGRANQAPLVVLSSSRANRAGSCNFCEITWVSLPEINF